MLYAALFAASSALLLAAVYWASAGYLSSQTDATIDTEIELLAERYRTGGLPGLVQLVEERIDRDSALVYVLVDPLGRRVAGNLQRWPSAQVDQAQWLEFEIRDDGPRNERDGRRTYPARARVFDLPGGFRLLVGHDIRELDAVQGAMLRAITWGLLATLGLSMLGAILVARGTLRRIEAIHTTCREIMAGDLSRRMHEDGSGDDFDQLAAGLNRMLDRIEALMEDVRRTSDNIAHDLRTPLTRLRNRLEIMAGGVPGTAERAELESALTEADRLLHTFNALLRIARIEHGAREGTGGSRRDSPVDLAGAIEDVLELYQPTAEDAGVQLDARLPAPGAPPGVAMDRDLLFQVLVNLVDNAVKFTPAGGRVELRLTHAPGRLLLTVSDDGPGIPPGDREHVFKRFYRGERSRNTEGNGLGLSLVWAVAQRYGLGLTLEDASPGLRVHLDLSAVAADAAPAPAPGA